MSADTKYAVINAYGKQHRVTVGQKIRVNLPEDNTEAKITFDSVLLVGDAGGKVSIGKPSVAGATVEAKVLGRVKEKKIVIYKKKRRHGYTKKQGHRQEMAELLISSING